MENTLSSIFDALNHSLEKCLITHFRFFQSHSKAASETVLVYFKIMTLQHFYDLSDEEVLFLINDRLSFQSFVNDTRIEKIITVEILKKHKTNLQKDNQLIDIFQAIEIDLYNSGIKLKRGKIQDLSLLESIDRNESKSLPVNNLKLSEIYIPTSPHPIFLRNGTTDFYVYNEVMNGGIYKLKLNFTPKFIIDCGANIGLTSIYFNINFPESLVIAIEPESSNYSLLERNTSCYYPDIVPVKGAIWPRKATVDLSGGPDGGHWGFMTNENSSSALEKVRGFSIQEIMEKYNHETIDILKIDIEGAEKEIFETNFEYWLPRTKVIIVETHDRLRAGCSKPVFAALSQYNFELRIQGNNLIFIKAEEYNL